MDKGARLREEETLVDVAMERVSLEETFWLDSGDVSWQVARCLRARLGVLQIEKTDRQTSASTPQRRCYLINYR